MAEYIRRTDALINCPNVAHDAIKAIPSADVVERKTGYWKSIKGMVGSIEVAMPYCSECGMSPLDVG